MNDQLKNTFVDLCRDGQPALLKEYIEIHLKPNTYLNNLREFLQKDIEKNIMIQEGFFMASRENHVLILEELLTNNLTQNYINVRFEESSALRIACKYGNIESVKFLLESPLVKDKPSVDSGRLGSRYNVDDLTLKQSAYGKPIDLACENNKIEVVKYLLSNDSFLKEIDTLSLESAFKKSLPTGNVEITSLVVNNLLDKKEGYELLDKLFGFNKSTWALHCAISQAMDEKQMEMVVYLMETFYYKYENSFSSYSSVGRGETNNKIKSISESLHLNKSLNKSLKENNTPATRKVKL